MECTSCGATIEVGQTHCPSCGAAVASAFAPPPPGDGNGGAPAESTARPDPFAAPPPPPTSVPTSGTPTMSMPTTPGPATGTVGATTAPPTQTLPIVPGGGYGVPGSGADSTMTLGVTAAREPWRLTPLALIAAITAITGIAAAFFDVVKLESDDLIAGPAKVGDLGTNSIVTGIIAAVAVLVAIALYAGRRPLASGLAAGASIGLAGWAALNLAVGLQMLDGWDFDAMTSATTPEITITKTYGIGFFLLVITAAAGVVTLLVAFASTRDAQARRFHPVAGLVGCLGAIGLAVGPLIPVNGAGFGDNFSNDAAVPATLILRVAVLGVLLVVALVGFLHGGLWGIGVAAGAAVASLVQVVTTISTSNDTRIGVGIVNFFSFDGQVHAVTAIGMAVWLLGVAIAAATIRSNNVR